MKAPGVVVADTTPLNYLILIDCAEILASLFGEVLIDLADEQGLFDGIVALHELRQTTFRAAPELLGRFEARMKDRRG